MEKKTNYVKTIFILFLVLVLLTAILYFAKTIYTYSVLKSVYDINKDLTLNNYQFISIDAEGHISTTYHKENRLKAVLENRIVYKDGEKAYGIMPNERQYMEMPEPFNEVSTVSSSELFGFYQTVQKQELFKLAFLNQATVSSEEYNNQKCYVITLNEETLWVNKDSKKIVKDNYEKESVKIELQIGNVTEENMEIPDIAQYQKIEL